MSEIPMITMWRGKNTEDMTRDELVEALKDACMLYNDLLESNIERSRMRNRMRNAFEQDDK